MSTCHRETPCSGIDNVDNDTNGRLTFGGINYDSVALGAEAIQHINGKGDEDDDFSFRAPPGGWVSGSSSKGIILGTDAVDRLTGDNPDQLLVGLGGNDVLNGGSGTDIALFRGPVGSYLFGDKGAEVTVTGPDGKDTLTNVEQLRFANAFFSIADRSRFNPLRYLNQNRGRRGSGIDPLTHYLSSGWAEGRDPTSSSSGFGERVGIHRLLR